MSGSIFDSLTEGMIADELRELGCPPQVEAVKALVAKIECVTDPERRLALLRFVRETLGDAHRPLTGAAKHRAHTALERRQDERAWREPFPEGVVLNHQGKVGRSLTREAR